MKVLRQSSHKVYFFPLYLHLLIFLFFIIYSDIKKCILKKGKKELSEKEKLSLDLYSNKEIKQDTKKQ